MKKTCLMFLCIGAAALNGCNSGASGSTATLGNSTTLINQVKRTTPDNKIGDSFPQTSAIYKSIAVIKSVTSDNQVSYKFAVVGKNNQLWITTSSDSGISSVKNWQELTLPTPAGGSADFNQVISCPYTGASPGVFVAVGDRGLTYLGIKVNNGWQWKSIPFADTYNLTSVACNYYIPKNDPNVQHQYTHIVIVGVKTGSDQTSATPNIFTGDLLYNKTTFYPNPYKIQFVNNDAKITGITFGGGKYVIVGTKGNWAVSNDLGETWTTKELFTLGDIHTVTYDSVRDEFPFGSDVVSGYFDKNNLQPYYTSVKSRSNNNTFGINSIACGTNGYCLYAGVSDPSNYYLINLREAAIASYTPNHYGAKTVEAPSQIIYNSDLSSFIGLQDNKVIIKPDNKQTADWRVISQQLPAPTNS